MLNLLIYMDAAPSPAIALIFMLVMAAFFIVVGLVTLSIIFTVKAIKRKKSQADEDNSEG